MSWDRSGAKHRPMHSLWHALHLPCDSCTLSTLPAAAVHCWQALTSIHPQADWAALVSIRAVPTQQNNNTSGSPAVGGAWHKPAGNASCCRSVLLNACRCAGVCHFSRTGGCRIKLSEPLLKVRQQVVVAVFLVCLEWGSSSGLARGRARARACVCVWGGRGRGKQPSHCAGAKHVWIFQYLRSRYCVGLKGPKANAVKPS